MEWLLDKFYLHPIPVLYLTASAYLTVTLWYFGRRSGLEKKPPYPTSLKPISLSEFLQYINESKASYADCGFDGSKLGLPIVEGILTGPYGEYTASLFQLVLPTGRSGVRQIVIHIRSATETLPDISINDPIYIPRLAHVLKQRYDFRIIEGFLNRTYEFQTAKAKGIVDDLKQVKGLVVDASGHDLFFYVSGKIAEPLEYENLIARGINLFKMIHCGSIDISLIQESPAESSYGLYIGAKNMLLLLPGMVLILLVGYDNKILTGALVVGFLFFFGIAKGRYEKYRKVYPIKIS